MLRCLYSHFYKNHFALNCLYPQFLLSVLVSLLHSPLLLFLTPFKSLRLIMSFPAAVFVLSTPSVFPIFSHLLLLSWWCRQLLHPGVKLSASLSFAWVPIYLSSTPVGDATYNAVKLMCPLLSFLYLFFAFTIYYLTQISWPFIRFSGKLLIHKGPGRLRQLFFP